MDLPRGSHLAATDVVLALLGGGGDLERNISANLVWYLLVSHPSVLASQMKWESVR